MRDLIEWVGRDAVRFFLVSRKADSEFVFDIDLALAQSEENPVYYVQYAHARVCSVFRQLQEKGFTHEREVGESNVARLTGAAREGADPPPDLLPGAARECRRARSSRISSRTTCATSRATSTPTTTRTQFIVDDVEPAQRAPEPGRGDAPGARERPELLGVSAPEKM